MNQSQIYDLIIIGAGPAGLTAGIYAAKLGFRTLMLEAKSPGGRAVSAWMIENYPGFHEGVTGAELVDRMKNQAQHFGAELKTHEEVVRLDLKKESKRVFTRKSEYCCSTIVIAMGIQRKKLNIPGEGEHIGSGVSYCAVCDASFFKNRRVALVGSTEEAVTEALHLAARASYVLVVNPDKGAFSFLEEKLRKKGNVKVINGQLMEILGEGLVDSIRLKLTESEIETVEKVSAVFISLGEVPMTDIVKHAGIDVDQNGCIKVDRAQRTNVEGVFAVGDCTCGGMQVITASGEGAMAAMKASTYMRNQKSKLQSCLD